MPRFRRRVSCFQPLAALGLCHHLLSHLHLTGEPLGVGRATCLLLIIGCSHAFTRIVLGFVHEGSVLTLSFDGKSRYQATVQRAGSVLVRFQLRLRLPFHR
jgi:hypothetical protein